LPCKLISHPKEVQGAVLNCEKIPAMRDVLAILAALTAIGFSPASAYPASYSIWMDSVGGGFRRDTFQMGGTVGAGFGVKVLLTERTHDLALASLNFGWMFTDVLAADKWYRGNLELLAELFSGFQFNPEDRYFIGLTPLLRYNFITGSRLVPFVDGGAGLSITDINNVDLTGIFQFNLQGGAGTHYFLNDTTALTVQYRWLHFSDASIQRPNRGTNTDMFYTGVTWFF